MNTRRIILGGLLAGVVISIGMGILDVTVIGTSRPISASATPLGVVLLRSALLGIFCVLLYALMRPRLGAGARTAIGAGIFAFLFGVLFPPFGLTMSGALAPRTLLAAIVWGAVLLPLAAMAGASVYREDAPVR